MAQGASNQHISDDLYIDRKTVETHVGNIFTKLNLTRATDDKRVLAVLAWLRMNQATTAE
jgi:DNA-binding NarL/FixJ family response regulator